MGRVNEDVVRYPAAEDSTAKQPNAVFSIGVNTAAVEPHGDGIQFLKGTPAGAAHVSLRDENGAPFGATARMWERSNIWNDDSAWVMPNPWG